MDLELKDKVVLICGGASNIGKAITVDFAREAPRIVLGDIDVDQAERVAKECQAEGLPGEIVVKSLDVTDLDNVKAVVAETLDEFGQIDVLVNVVGKDIPQMFLDTTPEFWEMIININYKGVLHTVYTVLPHMIERGEGAIVSIGSDAGRIGEYKEAVYGGCKAGVISFTKSIAREYGPKGIRANVVCPGMTMPEREEDVGDLSMHAMARGFIGQGEDSPMQPMIDRAKKWYPLRKIGKPTDVSGAVVFLSSNKAAGHITGQTVSASGGYSMM